MSVRVCVRACVRARVCPAPCIYITVSLKGFQEKKKRRIIFNLLLGDWLSVQVTNSSCPTPLWSFQ